MPRRYEVLVSIPKDLQFIQRQIDEADRLPPGDEARAAPIIVAAWRACALMARLTKSPPLWLAMQRQVLVHGWSFEDLKELDRLQVRSLPIVKVLSELHSSPPLDGERRIPDPESLVETAWEQFRQVRDRAVENMKASGLVLPDGSASVWVADSTLVDRTHEQLQRLHDELERLLLDARRHEPQHQAAQESSQTERDTELRDSERRWEQVLRVCVEVVTVVASITTVIVQAPEIWQDIEPYALELVRMVGQVGDSLGRQVNALLGMVIAIRQAESALGVDPGDGIDGLNRPSDAPLLAGDPSDVSVDPPQQQVSEQITGAGDITVEADSSPQQHIREGFVDATVRASGTASGPHFDPTDPPDPELIDDPGRFGRGDPSALEELERMAAEATRPPDPDDDEIRPWGPGAPGPSGSF